MRALSAVLLATALLVTAGVPAASADRPQKGRYGCFIPRLPYPFSAGYLYLTSKTDYRVNQGKGSKGKYKAVKGKRLKFPSGPHHNKWDKVTWDKAPDLEGETRTQILFTSKKSTLECVWESKSTSPPKG